MMPVQRDATTRSSRLARLHVEQAGCDPGSSPIIRVTGVDQTVEAPETSHHG
jgi:hypothetical protein